MRKKITYITLENLLRDMVEGNIPDDHWPGLSEHYHLSFQTSPAVPEPPVGADWPWWAYDGIRAITGSSSDDLRIMYYHEMAPDLLGNGLMYQGVIHLEEHTEELGWTWTTCSSWANLWATYVGDEEEVIEGRVYPSDGAYAQDVHTQLLAGETVTLPKGNQIRWRAVKVM